MKTTRALIFLIATLVLFATSCERESDIKTNDEPQIEQTSTYTVKVYGLEFPDNIWVTIYIKEYSSGNYLETRNWFRVTSSNMSRTYTADKNTSKMTVMIYANKTNSTDDTYFFINQVFYINKGGNTVIYVTGSSPTCDKDPLSPYK